MKRFYKDVSVKARDGGHAILLDGKPVRTPGGNALELPTEKLASAIAAEWRGQGDEIVPTTMPLLRLANTVIDGVAANRDEVIGAILRFGENDLICYRAHQPPDLVARQKAGWDPVLDWLAQRHGAKLLVSHGLNHVEQPQAAMAVLRRLLEGLDGFTLAGLHVIASVTGSLALALTVLDDALSGARAFELSRIDEAYQAEKWGQDAEAAKRTAALAHELDKAAELIGHIR
ncbi:MAG TPA: ATP12 family protein [Rhizomicrobium sp.]|jgi:chaperone required for assembly of F1-ATPase|nr:ATP12 family protein [Rhizomicrobium sp.]